MPRKKRRLRRLSGLTAVAALALTAGPAAASAADCEYGPTAPVFAPFGDSADYYLAPGGSFEGTLDWARGGGPLVVEGGNPFRLAGPLDSRALRLGSGQWATTPKMCVSPDTPHLRFLAKPKGSGQLDVEVRFYGPDGKVADSSSGSVSPHAHLAWAASRTVGLKVDKLARGGTGYVDVRFKGDWLVDDVFVDPYRRS